MKFIKHLLGLTEPEKYEYNTLVETEDDVKWNDEDALRLSHFFQEPTGLKLKAILNNYVISVAVEATRHPENNGYHCGVANGVAKAVTAIQNHFARSPRSEIKIEETEQPSVAESLALN